MNNDIVIKPSFEAKSNFKATLYLYGTTKRLFLYVSILFIIVSVQYFTGQIKDTFIIVSFIISFLLVFSYSIFIIYKNQKKQLIENPRLKENIFYIVNNEYFQEKGDSFEVKHFWKNLFQIVEKKDMFLIYTIKNRAILIKKSDLKENQYTELKELFNSINIKKSLK
jgi:mRNA-degrading endonuclease YafQ of YafQ-DinJ toxin-antitoxin module